MKRIIAALALLSCAALAYAQATPAKKELVAKVLQIQQPGIEGLSRQLAERPLMQLVQQAGNALQSQVPADKREVVAKSLEGDAKKYVEEAAPLIRERAIKLAPSTIGVVLEEKFTEDELKQLITWLESPVIKKYQQFNPEMQNSLMQKLGPEITPLLEPKFQALQQKMGNTLRAAAGDAGAKPAAPAAKPAAKAASK
jgi:hypothetical protein